MAADEDARGDIKLKIARSIGGLALVVALGACADDAVTAAPTVADRSAASLPTVVAYKSPTCGCCELWIEHMRAAGFEVEVSNTESMGAVKADAGVPVGQGSCHTALVDGYFIEGHVPASDIKRLLAERPAARGLMVPGMVLGSPGMEQGGVKQPYEVLLVGRDGATSVFSRHNQ